MNHTFPLVPVLTLLVGAAGAQDEAPAAKPQHLAVQAKVGAKASFRGEHVSRQVIEAMGRDSATKLTTDYTVEVVGTDDKGGVEVLVTWQRVQGSLASPMGGAVEFDTAAKDPGSDDPMLGGVVEAFVALAGKSVKIAIGADGEVTDKKALASLLASLTEGVDGMGRMVAQGILNENALAQQAQVFGSFPKEPTGVGGKWKQDTKSMGRGGMRMKTDVAHELVALDADSYRTKITGTIAVDTSKPAKDDDAGGDDDQAAMMREMMQQATIENGKVQGESDVNRKDGMLRKSSSKVTMAIHMPNPMGGEDPFVVQIEQTTSVTRVEPGAKPAK